MIAFDPEKPVYVRKQFFFGRSNSSIRYPSDRPLRLTQIPPKYRTEEYIYQGELKSSSRYQMIQPESNGTGAIEIEQQTSINNSRTIDTTNPAIESAIATPKLSTRSKTTNK